MGDNNMARETQINNIRKFYPEWNGEVPRLDSFQSRGFAFPEDLQKDERREGEFSTKLFQPQLSPKKIIRWAEPLEALLKTSSKSRKLLYGNDRDEYTKDKALEVAQKVREYNFNNNNNNNNNTSIIETNENVNQNEQSINLLDESEFINPTSLSAQTNMQALPTSFGGVQIGMYEPVQGFSAPNPPPSSSKATLELALLKKRKIESAKQFAREKEREGIETSRKIYNSFMDHQKAFIPTSELPDSLRQYREAHDSSNVDALIFQSTLRSFKSPQGFVPTPKEVKLMFNRTF